MGSFSPWSLLSGAVSGLFGLGTTALNNQAEKINTDRTNATNLQIARESNQLQQSENALNREFNASEAQKAYERELQKMQIQHQYNSPIELVAQMREAGLNPASASGGNYGTSMATSGQASYNTGLSPVMPNMIKPNLQPFPNIVDGMLNGALKLAEIKQIGSLVGKTDTEREYLSRSLEDRLRQLKADADITEFTRLMNDEFGFAKNSAELSVLEKTAFKLAAEGDLTQAVKSHERVKQELTKAMHTEKGIDIKLKSKELENYDKLFRSRLQVLASEANRNNASADESRKNAEYTAEKIASEPSVRLKVVSEALEEWQNYLGTKLSPKDLVKMREAASKKLEDEAHRQIGNGHWNPLMLLATILHPLAQEIGIALGANASVSNKSVPKKP